MPRRATVELDEAALLDAARTAPQVGEATRDVADGIAADAEALAPQGPGQGGHFSEMIVAEGPFVAPEGLVSRVDALKFTSWFLERGTGAPGPTPALEIMERAALASGHKFEPGTTTEG
jgi:hypothetical protein